MRAVLGLLRAALHGDAVVASGLAALPREVLPEELEDEHPAALHLFVSTRVTLGVSFVLFTRRSVSFISVDIHRVEPNNPENILHFTLYYVD